MADTMSNVIKLAWDDITIRGHARDLLSKAFQESTDPIAVVMIVLNADGKCTIKTTHYTDTKLSDIYSRIASVIDEERREVAG